MPSSRQLKSKLASVGNIKQITRAMQMVSATKMRKSQEVALRARPFAKEALLLLQGLVRHQEVLQQESIYFKEPKEGKTCLIVATSDKGLCGSFNSQVLRLAVRWLVDKNNVDPDSDKPPQAADAVPPKSGGRNTIGVDIVAVGRKSRDFFKNRGITPVAEFLQFSDIVSLYDVAPLSKWVLEAFEEGKYEKVVIVSTQFFSALVQKPSIKQLLPLNMEELKDAVKNIVPKTGKYADWNSEEKGTEELSHILEPSLEAILQSLVRNLVQVQILHYIFESNASEHSARMIAMKNATENAASLEDELKLALNKARQAAITQELTEISTAKEALSQG